MQGLKQYKCHKYVLAALILCVETDANKVYLDVGLGIPFVHEVSSEWMQKHDPKVGGYYVVYDSGKETEYHSYSPAHAFEGGYREMGAPPAGVEPTFTLRAQDRHAAGLVMQWANRARKHGDPVNEPKYAEAEKIAAAMEAWPIKKDPD